MNKRAIIASVCLSLSACASSDDASSAFRSGGLDIALCVECTVEKTTNAIFFVHRGSLGNGWLDPSGAPVYDAELDALELGDGSVLNVEDSTHIEIGAYGAFVWPLRSEGVPDFEKTQCTGDIPQLSFPPDPLPATADFDEALCDLPIVERDEPMSECDLDLMFTLAGWGEQWDACAAL